MSSLILGAHEPTTGGIQNAILSGKEFGCQAIQVFTSSPQMWKSKPITEAMVAKFKEACDQTGIHQIVSHDSYLINLCAPDEAKRTQSIEGMKGEIERCGAYGIDRVVSHMGAHMGQGEDTGLALISESIQRVLEETPDRVTVCMETTAGQGSSMLAKFEHIAIILENLRGHPRLAVCLDTCHIFAAGYDISTAETFEATFEQFSQLVGFDRLRVVHCNDSKKKLGSHVDRHDNLGQGEIGAEAFGFLVNDPRFRGIPIIVETPIENDGHRRDVDFLRSLVISNS
jgi:deoxyribonuclease IV